MKNKNICKLPTSTAPNELTVSCFVLETNQSVMMKKQMLANHRMILIEQGKGIFEIEEKTYPFCGGTLLFGFEGESISLLNGEDVRYLYVDFNGARAALLFKRFGIHPSTRKKENFNALIPFCKDCLISTRQECIDMVAESILLYVFSRISVERNTTNDVLQRIIDLTEENFRDPELSISTIAREIGYHPKYLSHFFKEKMNTSYSEYLRAFRFKHAISLFELGISSVKNVALLSGFSDPLYFSSSFKKSIGLSPTEFIATLSKRNEEN